MSEQLQDNYEFVDGLMDRLADMSDAEAREFIAVQAQELKSQITKQEQKKEAADMSLDRLASELSQMSPSDPGYKEYADAHRAKLQQMQQPEPLNESQQAVITEINNKRARLTHELEVLMRSPSKNMSEIQRVNSELKTLGGIT